MCAYGRRYAYEGMHMWPIPLVNDIFSSSVVLPTLSGVHLAMQFLFDLLFRFSASALMENQPLLA